MIILKMIPSILCSTLVILVYRKMKKEFSAKFAYVIKVKKQRTTLPLPWYSQEKPILLCIYTSIYFTAGDKSYKNHTFLDSATGVSSK